MNIRALKLAACALWVLPACSARIGDPKGYNAGTGPGSGSGPGSSTGSTGTGTFECTDPGPQAPVLHARLLSASQYNNTVQDLMKVAGSPASAFGGYGPDTSLDDLAAERRATAAAAVARQAAATLATWSPCVPPAVAAATCEQQIIDQIGLRAYRHPLSAAEKGQLKALFDAGMKESGGFTSGVEWFLTGLLQTPDFLYQFSKPSAGEQVGTLQPITAYEMASRLSYFVWDTAPDEVLYDAAAANKLTEVADLQTQLDRMLQDQPRFLRAISSFYNSWLTIDTSVKELARDAIDKLPNHEDVVRSLGTSLLMSATQLYNSATPNFSDLFSGPKYYFNGALRSFYGLPGTGTDFTPVELQGEDRNGLLTHPALLALFARPLKTHPINRGLFIRGKLLCQEMSPPPGIEFPPLPDTPVVGQTTREEVDMHVVNPFCASCHDQIDPPGFALENFDEVGRHRTTENGVKVDTSGVMKESGDLDGPFAAGADLLQRVSSSQTVKSCFAQQYFEYALARKMAAEDACSLKGVSGTFATSGDLKGIVVSIVNSDSFRLRASEGAP